MNPPYARGLIDKFATKLRAEVDGGRTTKAIVLVNAAVDTKWFNQIVECADVVGFFRRRVHFVNPKTMVEQPGGRYPQAIIGIGVSKRTFRKTFRWDCWVAELLG